MWANASAQTTKSTVDSVSGSGRILRELDGQEVRLRFSRLSADLYSYWIDWHVVPARGSECHGSDVRISISAVVAGGSGGSPYVAA